MYVARSAKLFPHARVAHGCVATIGAFDGLHLGHQKLLERVVAVARDRDLPSVVVSFEPTPKEYFSTADRPARLSSFREKYAVLERLGIDVFFCLRFDDAMSNISADTFIRQLLIHTMNTRYLVVGDDFRFAHNREGTLSHLSRVSKALAFELECVDSVVINGERVSSTAIRSALNDGEMLRVTGMLGNHYRMGGAILAHQPAPINQGMLTLLVNRGQRISAVKGFYSVRITGLGNRVADGVAFVGSCRSDGTATRIFGIHTLDVGVEVIGQRIDVDFVERLCSDNIVNGYDGLEAELRRYSAQNQEDREARGISSIKQGIRTLSDEPKQESSGWKTYSIWMFIAAVIVGLDQLTKLAIVKWVALYEKIELNSFTNITHQQNTGAAFSFLADAGGWQRWFLAGLATIVGSVIAVWLYRIRNEKQMVLASGLVLILGGAIGNVIDRIRLGYVIDFFQVLIAGWPFPSFNIADAAISVGAGLIIIDALFISGRATNQDGT